MKNPVVTQAFRRYHRFADECVKEVITEVFLKHGPSFAFEAIGIRIVLMECGSAPFGVVITGAIGIDENIDFFGYPEFCEDEVQNWQIHDVYSTLDRIALLASFFDPEEWSRVQCLSKHPRTPFIRQLVAKTKGAPTSVCLRV